MKKVLVIGGGIAGLTAAWDLSADHDVTVLEAADRVGGELRLEQIAGARVDVGAEAMLNRRPEGVTLAREAGLALEHPTGATSRLWIGDTLRPLPRSLMGVPLDVPALEASGVLSEAGMARVREEPGLPPSDLSGDDVSVGQLVGERFGDEVVDRLVEPLLGGVYAGRAREISARAAVPQLVEMAARGSLTEAAAALPVSDAPVFAGIPGGMGRLPATLAGSGRFAVRTGLAAERVERSGDGFRVRAGGEVLEADAVVVATPAAPSAVLLMDLVPDAAAALARIESADVVVVTFAVREVEARPLLDLGSSGFLVPPGERRAIKASTFSFAKWDWVRAAGRGAGAHGEDLLYLRTSLGRHRERVLQLPDHLLEVGSLADLHSATGVRLEPVATHVQRWPAGLPQYAVGHLDVVAGIRAELEAVPGLAVCGAAYDGVGIPAVIGSARAAAAHVRQQ